MRTPPQMLGLILQVARDDPRVRAVILNGSRVNPCVPPDIFQDFDVVYLVADVASFRQDKDWHTRFGELMIMQRPDEMQDPPSDSHGRFTYLMQFMDGNRLDLCLCPLSLMDVALSDSLSVVVLDKDGIVPPLPAPSESSYLPRPPTAKQFADCCNEFWWCAPYVAKGLWRRQITYAKAMLDGAVREQLMKMLAWYVGICTGFSANPGYLGKHLDAVLPAELWAVLLRTYSDADLDHTWDALESMTALFRAVALPVADHFGFEYPSGDDDRVSTHLRHARSLHRDAAQIY